MSSKRLAEKTAAVVARGMEKKFGENNKVTAAKVLDWAPKTAVGQMMSVGIFRKEAEDKVMAAEAKFEGAQPTKMLDPKVICASRWANRSPESFKYAEFKSLKDEIESAGGNVQPIKVRPKAGTPGEFEIAFGHRRHRACLELGLPVLALIDELTDAELFAQMDRENRQRADLRPYEQGVMYARALDEGLYPSMRKMAEALGVEQSVASRYIALARLPADVLAAFPSPLDLQQPWASPLTQALQNNPELVLNRARVMLQASLKPPAKQVFLGLTSPSDASSITTPKVPVSVKGKDGQTGEIAYNAKKRLFSISLSGLDEGRMAEIEEAIKALLCC